MAWPVVAGAVLAAAGGLAKEGEGGAKSKTWYEQKDRWSPEQQALFKQLTGTLYDQSFQTTWDPLHETSVVSNKPAMSAPAMSVGTTGQEQTYFDMINRLAQSKAASGQPLYESGGDWAQKYFDEAIKPMYMKEYEEITQPGISKAYAGNFYSSARQQEQSDAAQNLAFKLAEQRAGLAYGEEQIKRESMNKAFDQQLQIADKQGQAGALERSIEEEKTMENLQRFLMGEEVDGQFNPMNNPNMNYMMQILGLDPYVWLEQSRSEVKGKSGIGAMLSGLGGGMMSMGGK